MNEREVLSSAVPSEMVAFGVQFAVSVTLPLVERRFLKNTFPVAPFTHFVLELVSRQASDPGSPHQAVDVSSPLVTVHPANVDPAFVGADT